MTHNHYTSFTRASNGNRKNLQNTTRIGFNHSIRLIREQFIDILS
jgi:hypothetical protein